MLHTLELRDFAIVDDLELGLAPGFNALTGETGAGKSILIDALGLLVGDRADSALIRAGCDHALVQGVFEGGGPVSAARRLNASGRHSARLDGELVTVGELGEALGRVVAIFGQHAAAELQRAVRQRAQLDRLLAPDAAAALTRYRTGYASLRRMEQELEALRADARERDRRLDVLAYQIDDIDRAAPQAGEDEALRQEAEALGHAERILEGAGRAFGLLSADEGSAVDRVSEALRDLRDAARFDSALTPLAGDLAEAATGLAAVAGEIESFLGDFQADPRRLDAVHGRLAALENLQRKYGEDLAGVLAFRRTAAEERARLERVDDALAAKEHERAALRDELEALAAALLEARQVAARSLEERLQPLLAELGMPDARLCVELRSTDALGPMGRDSVRFAFVAHAGEPLAPLSAVASGGELSRIMLALHLVTGSDVPVLAFDEVDAGIGGRTARAVGSLLRRLARRHQVLVVTHLPQVAAFAHAHFAVDKREVDGRTVTRVARLEGPSRREELARMLSGSATPTSLRHAEELLSEAEAEDERPETC